MFRRLIDRLKRKKRAKDKHAEWVPSYTSGRTLSGSRPDDLTNPANIASPLHPLNPLNPINQAYESGSSNLTCNDDTRRSISQPSYESRSYDSGSSSYSSSDSGSSSSSDSSSSSSSSGCD